MSAPPQSGVTHEWETTIFNVQWRANDSDYVVARNPDGHAVVGNDPEGCIRPGAVVLLHGRWIDHPTHGRQFSFSVAVRSVPSSPGGQVRYLVDVCAGVGERRARAIVDRFGAVAVETLRDRPEEVIQAGLLPEGLAFQSSETLTSLRHMARTRIELLELLAGRGFRNTIYEQVIRLWGVRAPLMIRRSPYRLMLANLASAGFVRCDKLYLDLGGRPDAIKRQVLAGIHAIKEKRRGHTWFAREYISAAIVSKIGIGANPDRAIRLALRAGQMRERNGWLAISAHADAEGELANVVNRLLSIDFGTSNPHHTPATEPHSLNDYEEIDLSEEYHE